MYVTLEPCTHYGFTPPCTNIIKRKRIKNVYYLFNDPDKRTHKKAKKVLRRIFKLNHKDNKFKNFYKRKICFRYTIYTLRLFKNQNGIKTIYDVH